MTMVLRDSLGGNCRTVMVANITAQHEMLDESISTCRFAQRVALVANHVSLNLSACPARADGRNEGAMVHWCEGIGGAQIHHYPRYNLLTDYLLI